MNYDQLKKIIPPDQALANEALSRSLRQVKDIFKTDLPSLATAVSALESNKDLDLINDLTSPVPEVIQQFVGNVLATGTGPGNTITINDMIGTASGNTHVVALETTTTVLTDLSATGALDPLTGNGGSSSSINNGIYTLMQYALTGTYSNGGNLGDTTTIPNTNYYSGPQVFGNVDAAFGTANIGLIPAAEYWISYIATNNPAQAAVTNSAFNSMGQQLLINQNNCLAAGIDIGNVVNDINNANLVPNSISTSLGIASRLHDIGTDITDGGAAQFFQATAQTNTLTGQAVIATMREGRNIAVLNAAGIQLDTQLIDINPNTTVANNLDFGQYTASEAAGNIVF